MKFCILQQGKIVGTCEVDEVHDNFSLGKYKLKDKSVVIEPFDEVVLKE